MRIITAVALVARGLHQPLPQVKAMSLAELFMWAKISAGMEGRNFE